ncbi:TPA: hypothetical protein DDW35_00670, partial [Candidatus Sumerlaeota bacterium]|nr:hypothetical protein [Candidatus Sumerlaeota bacterium]
MFMAQYGKTCLTLLATVLLIPNSFAAEPGKITVKADQPGITISPNLYGVFYEEISRAGDGGLYAEMIQNRSFEDTKKELLSVPLSEKPGAWELVKEDGANVIMALDDSKPLNEKNKHSLKVTITNPGKGAGVANIGFHHTDVGRDKRITEKYQLQNGIPVQKGKQYNLSVYVRSEADFKGPLIVGFKGKTGMLAEGKITGIGADWKKFEIALTAKDTDPETKFVITSESAGTFYLDMVSVFPKDTFKNRPNGLRADLAQMVADMNPKFVRYPGGCWVAGHTLPYAVRWKNTIGD